MFLRKSVLAQSKHNINCLGVAMNLVEQRPELVNLEERPYTWWHYLH